MKSAWGPPAYVTGLACDRPHVEDPPVRAISPAEAESYIPTGTQAEFIAHVRRINGMLRDGRHTYSVLLFERPQVIAMVIREFRSAGWDVERVADLREADYLHFSRATGPR